MDSTTRSVPVEIWAHIFSYLDTSITLPSSFRSANAQVVVSHVCRYWRAIIISSAPPVWSNLSINIPRQWKLAGSDDPPNHQGRNLSFLQASLDHWLQCSGKRGLLNFSLGRVPNSLCDTILQYKWDNLNSLSWNCSFNGSPPITADTTPSLRTLSLTESTDITSLLRALPNLTSLYLVDAYHTTTSNSEERFLHKNIRTLGIRFKKNDPYKPLALFVLPNLAHLSLASQGMVERRALHFFTIFTKISACKIESFSISEMAVSTRWLKGCITHPGLRYVKSLKVAIEPVDGECDSMRMDGIIEVFRPRVFGGFTELERLELINVCLTDGHLGQILEERFANRRNGLARLEELSVVYAINHDSGSNSTDYHRLSHLKDRGMLENLCKRHEVKLCIEDAHYINKPLDYDYLLNHSLDDDYSRSLSI